DDSCRDHRKYIGNKIKGFVKGFKLNFPTEH
ncbi:unnamed protein product, partial [marine sediment metagenome]